MKLERPVEPRVVETCMLEGTLLVSPAVTKAEEGMLSVNNMLEENREENPVVRVEDPTKGVEDPTERVEDPTRGVEDPTIRVEDPTRGVEDPTKRVEDPNRGVDDPTNRVENPVERVEDSTNMVDNLVENEGDPVVRVENPTERERVVALVERVGVEVIILDSAMLDAALKVDNPRVELPPSPPPLLPMLDVLLLTMLLILLLYILVLGTTLDDSTLLLLLLIILLSLLLAILLSTSDDDSSNVEVTGTAVDWCVVGTMLEYMDVLRLWNGLDAPTKEVLSITSELTGVDDTELIAEVGNMVV